MHHNRSNVKAIGEAVTIVKQRHSAREPKLSRYNFGRLNNMRHSVPPFLPRLKPNRHLSPIFEDVDENLSEDFSKELLECRREQLKGPRELDFTRRAHSYKDLTVTYQDYLAFPPLDGKPPKKGRKKRMLKKRSISLNPRYLGDPKNAVAIFPDFRPCSNSSIVEEGTGKNISARKPKQNEEEKRADKQTDSSNSVASWLQFFG